jgi:small-conductance mechanosensitive channel
MGPFGSSIASTFLWFTLFIPYLLGNTVDDYRFRTFLECVVVPILVSFYLTTATITPYFLIPWQIMIPLCVVIFGVIMLISLLNDRFKRAAGGKESANWEGRMYLSVTIFIILMLGMLAYYYTALFQFSPLPFQME